MRRIRGMERDREMGMVIRVLLHDFFADCVEVLWNHNGLVPNNSGSKL